MGNPQSIKFRSINDFFDYLPEEELKIVETLRKIIHESLPDIKEKLAYNVPFYYRHQRICYIWPASVPWGGLKSGVSLGFIHGYLLEGIEKKEGKKIASIHYDSVSEINIEQVQDLLWQAYDVDSKRKRAPKH